MGKYGQPGYPLPDGELGEDEIVCQLVYLPNRPEYWQALYGALSYMATWKAWERDTDKRGTDAASNWRQSLELTTGCWRMACLDELQTNVAAILALLQNRICCEDGNVTYGDSTVFITTIIPGSGDPPDYYGETAVTDWDDWREHVCQNAHLWVDELILHAGNIEAGLEFGGTTIALIAAAIIGISFFVVGGVVAMPIVYAAIAGMVGVIAASVFEDAANDIEDSRVEIVCALLRGGDLAGAVEDALGSGAAWDLFYTLIDYDSAQAIIYEGGDGDTVFLDPTTRDDCECDQIGEYLSYTDFETGTLEDWATGGATAQAGNGYGGSWGVPVHYGSSYYIRRSVATLYEDAGLSGGEGKQVTIYAVKCWYKCSDTPLRGVARIRLHHDGGYLTLEMGDELDWTYYEKVLDTPLTATWNEVDAVYCNMLGGTGGYAYFDEVLIDYDAEED